MQNKSPPFPVKKALLAILALVAALAVVGFIYIKATVASMGRVDAVKIIAAAAAYSHGLTTSGKPVPMTVSLKELINQGLLKHEDVAAFDGMETTVTLKADAAHSQAILMRTHLADGADYVLLMDGSAQQVAPEKSP